VEEHPETRDASHAFSALLDDGTVVVWGAEYYGGKISDKHQTQLVNVKIIVSTSDAFAALLDNGTVVSWGDESFGGEITFDVENKLMKNVKMVFSTNHAFAALLNDDSVFGWGHCDIPITIQTKLIDVKQIIPKETKFTALCKNGEIYTW